MCSILLTTGGMLGLKNDLPYSLLSTLITTRQIFSALAPHLVPIAHVSTPPFYSLKQQQQQQQQQQHEKTTSATRQAANDDDDTEDHRQETSKITANLRARLALQQTKPTRLRFGEFLLFNADSAVFTQDLSLTQTPSQEDFVAILDRVPYVKVLHIGFSTDLNNLSLDALNGATRGRLLHTLELVWATNVKDSHFEQLAKSGVCPQLRTLSLQRCDQITDAAFSFLVDAGLRLQKLELHDCCTKLTAATLASLASPRSATSTTLKSLSIAHCEDLLTDEAMKHVVAFRDTLLFLSIRTSKVMSTDVMLSQIPQLTYLSELNIAVRRVPATTLDAFKDMMHLTKLRIEPFHGARDDHVEAISKFAALEELQLGYCNPTTDAALSALSCLFLQRLRFSLGPDCTAAFLLDPRTGEFNPERFASLTRLEVHVTSVNNFNVFFANICKFKRLRSLTVFGRELTISDEEIELVANSFPDLERLELHGCGCVTTERTAVLRKLKKLWHVNLYDGSRLIPVVV